MAHTTRSTADPTRRAAFAGGLFYLITFASSIPAALLLAPILTDPGYIVGPGRDGEILLACLLDLVNALTAVGSAVAVFSVIKRQHEGLALGFVTTRLVEAAVIIPGICALLAVVSIRQAGPAAGADEAALIAVGQGLVGVRDWTFILGPSLMPGFNALMFATVLYRARLVPRWIPALGLIGGPLMVSSVAGVILGLHELGSVYSAIALVPIFIWELSVGLWMTFKGFNRNSPILRSDSTDEAGGPGSGSPITTAPSGATIASHGAPADVAAMVATPSRFARIARLRVPRIQLRRRHLLVLAGLALAVVGNAEAEEHGIGLATVLVFSLVPSLPLLLGMGQPKIRGHLAARVVPLFNAAHEPLLPLMVSGLGVIGVLPAVALSGGLVWLGSIVIAWGLGDGLREAHGGLRPAPARWTSVPGLAPRTGQEAAA
ncbi:MAG TPA: DUF4386 domain-containing protein [Candidatus Limnocylindrales bacterium]|nr:DUF4386 domain-containing protein [Candidatus Limnocylindrales bacterium]